MTQQVSPLDTTAEVRTPEMVRFHYRVVGPTRRLWAYLVDLLLRLMVLGLFGGLVAIGMSASGADMEGFGGVGIGLIYTIAFLLEWLYFVLCETLMGGRSVGKLLFGLRVVKESGKPLTFADSLLRNLLRAADMLPGIYTVGFLVMSRDSYFRRLGDLVAGTLVISDTKVKIREPIRVLPPPSREELAPLVGTPGLSARELEALELFMERSAQLSQPRQEELAEIIAPTLARRLGVSYKNSVRFLALLYIHHTANHGAQLDMPAGLTAPPEVSPGNHLGSSLWAGGSAR